MVNLISPSTLQSWLHDTEEVALFDVREHGQYGESHPFFAVSLPYSRLELDVPRLAPRLSVRMVLIDEDESVARRAARRLSDLGYTRVHVVAGGVSAWAGHGFPLFSGVHVPSKAFGELVEHAYGTPSISAPELAELQARDADVVVLDGRPFQEYQKMNIPNAICCPNGELPLRIHRLVPNDTTKVIVNCAGRTRSIIGAQTLINLGIPNPVFALENGTQGWYLNELALEHGSARRYPDLQSLTVPPPYYARTLAMAEALNVGFVDDAQVSEWLGDPERTCYLFDVRTEEEFATATRSGAVHAAGGQLLQATDLYIGVRRARVVVFDSGDIRALTIAAWLRQMGHECWVLKQPSLAAPETRAATRPAVSAPALAAIEVAELERQMRQRQVVAVDIRSSMAYRRAHAPGSLWSIRPRLADRFKDEQRPIVLIADDVEIARLAASELPPAQRQQAAMLNGGFARWRAAGLPIAVSPDTPPDAECIDFLFFVHDRHDGNKEAARQYLAWELGLIEQLHPQDLDVFRLPHAVSSNGQ